MGPLAVGSLPGGRGLLFSAHGFFSDLRLSHLVENHGGSYSMPKKEAARRRSTDPAPGPFHRPGGHHRYRLHRRGGHGHLLRRAGGGVLDVGLRPGGHDDRLCGENLGGALPGEGRSGPLAGRAHGVYPGRPASAWAGGHVFSVLRGGDSGRGQSGPGQLHRHLPPRRLRRRPAGGGSGAGGDRVSGAARGRSACRTD